MSRIRRWRIQFGAFAASCLVAGACDGGTGPAEEADTAGADAIAAFLADGSPMPGGPRGGTFDPRTGTFTFTRSGACPAGGTQQASGTTTTALNNTTSVLTTSWSTTTTHEDCAFVRPSRDQQQVTTTIDGTLTTTGSSSVQVTADRGTPAVLLSYTNKTKGSTTTSTTGEAARTCEMDVTETYDPVTKSYTLKGVVCGQQVTITRTPGQLPGVRR